MEPNNHMALRKDAYNMDDLVIETEGLTKYFGEISAAKDVHLHVKKGEIYGLLGRNGAGKTTIMKMLCGLTKPSKGTIRLFGKRFEKPEKGVLNRIGVMIETPGFYPNLTATENLEILAGLRGTIRKDAVRKSLERVGLPYKDRKLYAEFSLGMKQRVGIAAAIIHDPELLILDEPVNGLDPIGVAEVRSFLKELASEYGKTILLSSHILSEIDLIADRIGIIHAGILLEERNYRELKEENMQYISLRAEPVERVVHILDELPGIREYRVGADGTIQIFDPEMEAKQMVKAFAENGIFVDEIYRHSDTLEDYFKKITGGEGIA